MFAQSKNTLAKAKLIYNKKLQMYKLVCAFNVTETKKQFNKVVNKFPVQAKCDYVSGDLHISEVASALKLAEKHLRTNNIVIVE